MCTKLAEFCWQLIFSSTAERKRVYSRSFDRSSRQMCHQFKAGRPAVMEMQISSVLESNGVKLSWLMEKPHKV